MIRFECDYAEGAHPKILEALFKTNFEQTPGYGADSHCNNASSLIRKAIGKANANAYFVVGGTQANKVVVAHLLRPHQGVVCVKSGHIGVHEAGAIESSGHKVLTLKGREGKLIPAELETYLKSFFADPTHDHMVEPGMVYISYTTETGTIYSKKELREISEVCKKWAIPLYLDGARLGYGLKSQGADVCLEDIANLVDVFYIGATKIGALFGEAIVFTGNKENLDKNFFSTMKQNGAVLAKGRLLGIQFETLFTNNLYEQISEHAVLQALRIKKAFQEKGADFAVDSPSNQQFPILPRDYVDRLKEDFAFEIEADLGQPKLLTRFCTSWATKAEDVDTLIKAIAQL